MGVVSVFMTENYLRQPVDVVSAGFDVVVATGDLLAICSLNYLRRGVTSKR